MSVEFSNNRCVIKSEVDPTVETVCSIEELSTYHQLVLDELARLNNKIKEVTNRSTLFKLGEFTLHSASKTKWKIDADALTDKDIQCLAFMLSEKLPPFSSVVGVPRGGLRIAKALEKYVSTEGPVLVVDDVFTTGKSLEEAVRQLYEKNRSQSIICAVLFSRGPCPDWVTTLSQW